MPTEAVSPCFSPLSRERALPPGVRGPVDFFALARLAARRRSETWRGELETGPGESADGAGDAAAMGVPFGSKTR